MTGNRVLVAAYGSLKEGFYNHPVLGEDAKLMGKTTVEGVMFLTGGGFPRLYHTDPIAEDYAPTTHEVEVYSVNMDAYESIRYMELNAGYDEEELLTEWGTAKIYYSKEGTYSEHYKYIKAYTKEVIHAS